jgi:O-antigen biosynthesis protein
MSAELERHARYRWAARIAGAGKVLDAGCGIGRGTACLATYAHEAIGVDISPAAIEEAKTAFGDQARFHEADVRHLPFGDGEFDVVVCFEVIAHVLDTELVLDELHRVLRPGGMLLISSPNRDVYPAGNPLHLREMTRDELEEHLASRFANVALYGQHTYFASLLGVAATLAHEVQVDADVAKLVGSPPGSELYSIAAATDAALPPEPAIVVLGEHPDYEQQRHELAAWRQRAIEAEAEALALRNRLQR